MSKSLMLSPNDGGVIDALPISRRNLLARGGALGTASTLGLGLGTILVPAVSHAYDPAPADKTVYSKSGTPTSDVTGNFGGVSTRFISYELTTGNFITTIWQKASSGLWAIKSAVTGITYYYQFYNGVKITTLSDGRRQIVLTAGVGIVDRSHIGGDIDNGRQLVGYQWPYPRDAIVLENQSLEEYSDANTVMWTKFRVGSQYALCMTICHLTAAGDRSWSGITTLSAAAKPEAYKLMSGLLTTLQTTAAAYNKAHGRQRTTAIASSCVAVVSVIGIALSGGTLAGAGGVAIVASLAAASAAAVYASDASTAFIQAGAELNTQYETLCSCGHIVR